MPLSETLLPQFQAEFATTRRVLARVADDRLAWKPHVKSFSMGALATHLANLPTWVGISLDGDSFDVAPKAGAPPRNQLLESNAAILEAFDRNGAAAIDAIKGATDERLSGPWTLLNGGVAVFTMPRIAVLRTFVLSHSIHHRGQMSVYLRMCDIPVPSIYGPTADEG